MGTIARIVMWVAGIISTIFTVIRTWMDFVGRSTYEDDYHNLPKVVTAVIDFIAEQPGWLVYGSFVVVVGLMILSIALKLDERQKDRIAPASKETFVADLHPKELFRYLCEDAIWTRQFGNDRLAWFNAIKATIRDELLQGRRMHAQGRASGKWGDGTFRHPADFIDRHFWAHGDLNWIRIVNADYSGDIDAYDPGYESKQSTSFDDVMFCRREAMAIWPKRSWLARLLRPTPFEPFETPPYGPPPWQEASEGNDDVGVGVDRQLILDLRKSVSALKSSIGSPVQTPLDSAMNAYREFDGLRGQVAGHDELDALVNPFWSAISNVLNHRQNIERHGHDARSHQEFVDNVRNVSDSADAILRATAWALQSSST